MIHVLLMILKIIGIILLVILGLLLTAVLLILFVPVRYQADASFDGKPDGEAAVSWLFRLVRIRVSYHEHADVSGRVLWFKLFDVRLWPPENDEAEEPELVPEPVAAPSQARKTPVVPKADLESEKVENPVAEPVLTETKKQEDPVEAFPETSELESAESVKDENADMQPDSKEDDELVVHATGLSSESDMHSEAALKEESSENKDVEAEPQETQIEDSSQQILPVEIQKELPDDEEPSKKDKPGFSTRIKEKLSRIIKKLRALSDKLRKLPGKIQKVIDDISKKKISLEKTWNSISMFWHDEQNQKAFHLIWKRTKKLVRYVLPRKFQGRIHFGFDDPYDTGQVLTAVSPFYGLYAKTLTLEPDFTGTTLDGEIHLKGRIALWYPLWTAARLFISKDFRRLLRFLRKRESETKEM